MRLGPLWTAFVLGALAAIAAGYLYWRREARKWAAPDEPAAL